MLYEYNDYVSEIALQKILTVVDNVIEETDESRDRIASIIIPSLLHTLHKTSSDKCRYLVCMIFGELGAIDPGRISYSNVNDAYPDRRSEPIIFVDDREKFLLMLLERASSSFSTILNADAQEECSYSIQVVLQELFKENSDERLWKSLSEKCRNEVALFRYTKYTKANSLPLLQFTKPIIECKSIPSYASWLCAWCISAIYEVKESQIRRIFEALHGMIRADLAFGRFLLPHIIVQLINENNCRFLQECKDEILVVFEKALVHDGWPRLAAHATFSIIDCLERYANHRADHYSSQDKILIRTKQFLASIMTVKTNDRQSLCCVAVAERWRCLARALRWCEEYGMQMDMSGSTIEEKNFYSILQGIYSEMGDTDGVLGAFAKLNSNGMSGTKEKILALEANGDFWEALSLYEKSKDKLSSIRCLLHLNEAQLALTSTQTMLQISLDAAVIDELRACQLEATYRLGEWDELEKLVDNTPSLSTIGACSATLLCNIKFRDIEAMNMHLSTARMDLMHALTAMTVEDCDTYAQAYKYVIQLHILAEIEYIAKNIGCNPEAIQKLSCDSTFKRWQKRGSAVMQHASALEPILSVRRGLLTLQSDSENSSHICDLLVQSSRISRLSCNLQTAWNFLIQAKNSDIKNLELAFEDAMLHFAKGYHTQAVLTLSNLIQEVFPEENNELLTLIAKIKKGENLNVSELKTKWKVALNDRMDVFVKAQLLLADYSQRTASCSHEHLYLFYKSLSLVGAPCEELYYRAAVFVDSYIHQEDGAMNSKEIALILNSYMNVLLHGRSHLFHVMPRMLTVWLDHSQRFQESIQHATKKEDERVAKNSIKELNSVLRNTLKQIDCYMFYVSFAQLISRICHPSEEVFDTLKMVISKLFIAYPHQCLWQSIAVFRCDPRKQRLRHTRCRNLYEFVKRSDKTGYIRKLIAHYEYVAASFIRVAEDNCPVGSHSNFSSRYQFLSSFFSHGKIDPTIRVQEKSRENESRPTIIIPLCEMIQHNSPEVPKPLSQVQNALNDNNERTAFDDSFANFCIYKFDERFDVIKSLAQPKKITILASNGKYYSLMCKAKDELRKDSRFMDVSKMMNNLLRQDADARRRHLFIRTYSVVPLQESGGLIEWIPNLSTFRSILTPLMHEKCPDVMSDKEWFSRWKPNISDHEKVALLKNEYYPRHPLVLGEWFRRTFPDPCKWYKARLAFIHTSAVMCMVGFILGLGDRHAENLLIDVTNGDAIHVDFNLIFNKGEFLMVPEVVPFRLTRNIIDAFGAAGLRGTFKHSCETTMRVIRENQELFHTVLQTFVHDPLVEWMHNESRAQQLRQSISSSNENITRIAQQQAKEIVDMIYSRLKGHVVSPKIYSVSCNAKPMSVEGQVETLIKHACDEVNLARMYIGWASFL